MYHVKGTAFLSLFSLVPRSNTYSSLPAFLLFSFSAYLNRSFARANLNLIKSINRWLVTHFQSQVPQFTGFVVGKSKWIILKAFACTPPCGAKQAQKYKLKMWQHNYIILEKKNPKGI